MSYNLRNPRLRPSLRTRSGRRSQLTLALLLGLLACGTIACGTVDRRIDPDAPDEVGGAVLDSQDIRSMADAMARDLVASGVLVSREPSQRVTFHITQLRNDSNQPMDKELILTQIRTQLMRALGRQVQVLDRSKESLEDIRKEREAKRSGAVTSKEERMQGLAGSDYVLKGTIKDQVKQSGKLKSVYYVVTFELTDLESSELVWSNDYQTKFESEKSVITR